MFFCAYTIKLDIYFFAKKRTTYFFNGRLHKKTFIDTFFVCLILKSSTLISQFLKQDEKRRVKAQ